MAARSWSARADQLRAAIVEKEQRQISRYFGSKEGFGQAIHEFLMNYLGNENPNNQSNTCLLVCSSNEVFVSS